MSRRTLLLAAVAVFAPAGTALAQDASDPYADSASVEQLLRRSLDATPGDTAAPQTTDPYPLADAGVGGDGSDPYALPGDAAATGSLPGEAPATTIGLRSSSEVAPLRTVVQPVQRSSAPALPVTGPIPAVRDGEADARGEYDPVGLRAGSFVVGTTLTTAVGYSSNANESANGSGSAYLRAAGEVTLRSDWERHGLDVTLRGGLRRFTDGSTDLEPNADVRVDGRYDLTDVDRIGVGAGWTYTRENAGSVELGANSSGADINTLSASIGYERSAGLVGVALKGAVDRTVYEEGEDRTNTAFSGSLRLSLDTGAVVEPFVEAGTFTRRYDSSTDSAGYRRSSLGFEGKTGFTVDTGLVKGEASVGYAIENPDDERLDDLSGITADAALSWTPSELWTVNLRGTTTFEPSQLAQASGSVVHAVDADIAYALRPNIILSVGGGFSYQDYTGVARTVETSTVRAGAEWRMNRSVALGLTASHSNTDSSVAGEGYDESRVEASVTFRH